MVFIMINFYYVLIFLFKTETKLIFYLGLSANLDLLATSIITYYHDVFPVNEFSEVIADYLCSYEKSLEKYVHKLPPSIQNVSNPSIKIEENLSNSIHQLTQKIYHLLLFSLPNLKF